MPKIRSCSNSSLPIPLSPARMNTFFMRTNVASPGLLRQIKTTESAPGDLGPAAFQAELDML